MIKSLQLSDFRRILGLKVVLHMKNRGILHLFCLVLLLSLVLGIAPSAQAAPDARYGYGLLENDAQRAAYTALSQGVGRLDNPVKFQVSGISGQDVQAAIRMVHLDFPEYFWFHGDGQISLDSAGKVEFTPGAGNYLVGDHAVTAATIGSYQTAMDSVANRALSAVSGKSKYDTALYLHDFVAAQVTYAQVGDHQTAYGALVGGKAVCAGYARAYQYLLGLAGIQSFYVTGQGYNNITDAWEGHGWNLVFLDGKCYYTDVTWDDQGEQLYHAYFMQSLEEMEAGHVPDEPGQLPSCGHSGKDYFTVKAGLGVGRFTSSTTVSQMAGMCAAQGALRYSVQLLDTVGNFAAWFDSHWGELCQALGLGGTIGYELQDLGREYHIALTGTERTSSTEPPRQTTPPTVPTDPPAQPTQKPTQAPTQEPTAKPTEKPTQPSAQQPTEKPTEKPAEHPTTAVTPTAASPTTPPDLPTAPPVTQGPAAGTTPTQEQSTEPAGTVGTQEGTQPSVGGTDGPTVSDQTVPRQTEPQVEEPGEEPGVPAVAIVIGVCVFAAAAAGIGVPIYLKSRKK